MEKIEFVFEKNGSMKIFDCYGRCWYSLTPDPIESINEKMKLGGIKFEMVPSKYGKLRAIRTCHSIYLEEYLDGKWIRHGWGFCIAGSKQTAPKLCRKLIDGPVTFYLREK